MDIKWLYGNQSWTEPLIALVTVAVQKGWQFSALPTFTEGSDSFMVALHKGEETETFYNLTSALKFLGVIYAPETFAGVEFKIEDPAAYISEVRNIANRNLKIDAIKLLRLATGMGLKDAKEAVEALMLV